MTGTTENRRCRPVRGALRALAAGAVALAIPGCAQVEVGAHTYKTLAQSNHPATARTASGTVARQSRIDPALQPDRAAFYATGVAAWDGAQTLPGIWVAHPMTERARRVRLTNDETGVQADAALLRRDPNQLGPTIMVSTEAAQILGFLRGRGTPITIEALVRAPAAGPAEAAGAAAPSATVETSPLPSVAVEAAGAGSAPDSAPDSAPPDTETAADADAAAIAADAVRSVQAGSGAHARPAAPPAPADPPATAPAAEATASEATTTEITNGRRFIQVGIFGQPDNIARLMKELRAAGLTASEHPVTFDGRKLTRILVGPYDSLTERAAALRSVRRVGPPDAFPARG